MALEFVGDGIHNHVCNVDECSEILEEDCTLDCDEEEVELCPLHSGPDEEEEEEGKSEE